MLHPIEQEPRKPDPGDYTTTGYDLVEDVPTAQKVDGVWQTGKMPTSEGVLNFVGKITREYLTPITDFSPYSEWDIHDFNKWWVTFLPQHAPINDWATSLDDNEEALLEYACKILSSHTFGTTVMYLKQSGIYPSEWRSLVGFHRSTTERLFDRLRINHVVYGHVTKRWPVWWGHAQDETGVEHGPQTTIFGRRHADNGFYLLRKKLASNYNTLGKIVGLTDAPDTFAMPLDWKEAIFSGLSPDVKAKLPKEMCNKLHNFADSLDAAVNNTASTSLWGSLITAVAAVALGAPGLGALFALFGSESKKLAKSLAPWVDSIRYAAAEGAELNDAAYYLLKMLRTTNFKGLLGNKLEDALNLDDKVFILDLYHDQVQDVEYAMRPDLVVSPITFQPMIVLGDTFATYARKFGTNPKRGVNPFQKGNMKKPSVVAKQRNTAQLWINWWNDSQPTLDMSYVLDTASIILEQLLYLDDALLALNDIAAGDGMIATMVRNALAEHGFTRYVDALGGVSPGAALRYFFRQILTDLFLDWFTVKEQISPSDVYPILCWMNTRTKRGRIEDALGPLIEATEENAGGMWPMILALRILFEYQPDEPISVRGAFLPNVADDQKGALGRAFATFKDYPNDAESAAAAISHCDLGNIRGWLELTRQSCLVGLQDSLEPHWNYDDNTDAPDGPLPDDTDLPRKPGPL